MAKYNNGKYKRGEFMEKNKIFSKLNIKDYNNELEEILENKIFSLEVKNLLLSMLYKMENAYKDYMAVKVEVLPEKDFISYIIKTIEENCFDIEFISPEKEEKIQINKEKGLIRCYPNEKSLLSAIWYMGEDDVDIVLRYSYAREAVQRMVEIGSNSNQIEILRDFNGWSWDIVVKEIESIPYNIIYQSLLLLDGKKLIYANMNSEKRNSILLQKNEKESAEFSDILTNCVLKIYKQENPEISDKLEKIKKEKNEELKLLDNKKEFVQKITNQKKECLNKIEQIDKTINNTELLKQEYKKRNALLPSKEKIFSISHLTDRLEKERKELLEQLAKCNKMIDPKEFVKEKEKIKQEVKFLNEEKSLIDCCKAFLKCVQKQIESIEERTEIIQWIYKIRYYRYVTYDEEKSLKDIKELEKEFKQVMGALIKKTQENKIWDIFTENAELAYIVIKELLDSKMINFENVNIVCKYENGILYLEYYDGNILETRAEFKLENVRIKKKIKLFI